MKRLLSLTLALLLMLALLCACAKPEETKPAVAEPDGKTPFELIASEVTHLTDGKRDFVLALQYDTASSEDGKSFEKDVSLTSRTVMNKNGSLSVQGTMTADGETSQVSAAQVGTVLYIAVNDVKIKTDLSSSYASDEADEMAETLASFTGSFSMFEIEKEWLGARTWEEKDGAYILTLTFTQDEITAYKSAILELFGNTYSEKNITLEAAEYQFTLDSAFRLTGLSLNATLHPQGADYRKLSYRLTVSYPDPMPAVTAPADADEYTDIDEEYDFDEN